jgi:hypothetical protein
MVLRPCLELGCGTPSPRTRCPAHTRQRQQRRDQQRGTTAQRGYGAEHDRIRAEAVATYQPSDPCWRCGLPLGPDPSLLDLGHTDDRQGWMGLEHQACSRGKRLVTR